MEKVFVRLIVGASDVFTKEENLENVPKLGLVEKFAGYAFKVVNVHPETNQKWKYAMTGKPNSNVYNFKDHDEIGRKLLEHGFEKQTKKS